MAELNPLTAPGAKSALIASRERMGIRMRDAGADRPRYWTWAALMRRA